MISLHTILRLLKLDSLNYVLEIATLATIALLDLAAAYVVKLLFDALTMSAPVGLSLWAILAILAGTGVAQALAIAANSASYIRLRHRVGMAMQHRVLRGVYEKRGSQGTEPSPGEALATFRDDTQTLLDLFSRLADQVCMQTYSIVALIVLLTTDARMTGAIAIPLLAVFAISAMLDRNVRRLRERRRLAAEQVAGAIGDAVASAQAIQLASAEDAVAHAIDGLGRTRARIALRDRLLEEAFESLFNNAATIGVVAILLAVALGIQSQSFSVGDLALFIGVMGRLTRNVATAGVLAVQLKQADVSVTRVRKLAGDPSGDWVIPRRRAAWSGPRLKPSLSLADAGPLKRVSIQVRPSQSAGREAPTAILKELSFFISRGELVVLAGEVGAGKTTLVRMILGLLPGQAGLVRWNGLLVDDPSSYLVPPRVAYCPQFPVLLSDTVAANISLDRCLTALDWQQLLERSHLAEDVRQWEHGLNTTVGSQAAKLSGGQRQRIAAARMLARDAEFLVIDDLSSSLDIDTEMAVWDQLQALPNATILAVSNQPAVWRRASRILVLERGRLIADGRLDEVLSALPTEWPSGLDSRLSC